MKQIQLKVVSKLMEVRQTWNKLIHVQNVVKLASVGTIGGSIFSKYMVKTAPVAYIL